MMMRHNESIFKTLDELEKEHILSALDLTQGNKRKTARLLGITIPTLYSRLVMYGLHVKNEDKVKNAFEDNSSITTN